MTKDKTGRFANKPRRTPKPLNCARLDELALAYVARFATSAGKLERYLARKLRERGWDNDAEPDIAGLIARYRDLGYIDDVAYARMKGGDLLRRGYGARRVAQALNEAGIAEEVRHAMAPGEAEARSAVAALARRRRLGPFFVGEIDRARHEKQLAAIMRAGHGFDAARAVMESTSESALAEWVAEAQDEDDG